MKVPWLQEQNLACPGGQVKFPVLSIKGHIEQFLPHLYLDSVPQLRLEQHTFIFLMYLDNDFSNLKSTRLVGW